MCIRLSGYSLEEWMLRVNDKNNGMIIPNVYAALLLDMKLSIFLQYFLQYLLIYFLQYLLFFYSVYLFNPHNTLHSRNIILQRRNDT